MKSHNLKLKQTYSGDMPVYHSDNCNLCLSVFISRPEKREKDEVSSPEPQAKSRRK